MKFNAFTDFFAPSIFSPYSTQTTGWTFSPQVIGWSYYKEEIKNFCRRVKCDEPTSRYLKKHDAEYFKGGG